MMGISNEELENMCDELFSQNPIKFKARQNDEIDLLIAQHINENDITIPIVYIKNNLYLIGS